MKIKLDDVTIINNDVLEDCDLESAKLGLEIQSWARLFFNNNPTRDKVEIER